MTGYLGKREQEILDIIYERGKASAETVRDALGGTTSNSTVRTMLGILEDKGLITHEISGKRYIYCAKEPRANAGIKALKRAIRVFFENSPSGAIATLIRDENLETTDLDELAAIIENARKGDHIS